MVELPPEEKEEDEEALASDGELSVIEQMLARREPYERVMSALDALVPPADDVVARASIAHTRLTAASMYERDARERCAAIEDYMAAEPTLWRRLSAVLAACVDSPSLFRRYVEPLIADAEAASAAEGPLVEVLATARKSRERVLGKT